MTRRQLWGFALACFSFLVLALIYWIAQIYWGIRPNWVFAIGALVAAGWGRYASSDFAKKRIH